MSTKTLATIDINVPVQFDADTYELGNYNNEALAEISTTGEETSAFTENRK